MPGGEYVHIRQSTTAYFATNMLHFKQAYNLQWECCQGSFYASLKEFIVIRNEERYSYVWCNIHLKNAKNIHNNYLITRKVNPTIESYRKLYMKNEFGISSSKELRNAVAATKYYTCTGVY